MLGKLLEQRNNSSAAFVLALSASSESLSSIISAIVNIRRSSSAVTFHRSVEIPSMAS